MFPHTGGSDTSAPYAFHNVKSSPPHYMSHDQVCILLSTRIAGKHYETLFNLQPDRLPSSRQGLNSVYSNSAQPSAPENTFTTRISSTHGSSMLSTDYHPSHSQNFETVNTCATIPDAVHTLFRAHEIPDEDDDPKKMYQCKECGKGFRRSRDLDVGNCFIYLLNTMLTSVFCIHRYTHEAITLQISVRFLSCLAFQFLIHCL